MQASGSIDENDALNQDTHGEAQEMDETDILAYSSEISAAP